MNPLLLIFPVIGIAAGVIVALIDKVSGSICMEEDEADASGVLRARVSTRLLLTVSLRQKVGQH